MKKSRFSEEQIAYALKQVESGTEKVAGVCRKMGVSQHTFYAWRKKYAGMGVVELRRMKQLEEEMPLPLMVARLLKVLPRDGERVFQGVSEANAERDWWRLVREHAIVLGVEHFTKHDLRRTCATGTARKGAAPWVVSRILGHATTEGAVAVTGIYNRYSGLAEMSTALTAWADHVTRITSTPSAPATILPMPIGRRRALR